MTDSRSPDVAVANVSSGSDPLTPKYTRVLLKLSGEAFGYGGKSGISLDETRIIAEQLKRVHARGVQLAIVVGGGNILRGAQFTAEARRSSRPPPITWACWRQR